MLSYASFDIQARPLRIVRLSTVDRGLVLTLQSSPFKDSGDSGERGVKDERAWQNETASQFIKSLTPACVGIP